MKRLTASLPLAVLLALVAAPLALAHDGGEGWFGETNDLAVTLFGFGVIAFFPLFIATMSFIQWRLDKRKEAAKARAPGARWSGGW